MRSSRGVLSALFRLMSMRLIEVSLVLTPGDAGQINVPAIREAKRRIETSSGFNDPSFEGIRFYFAEVNALYVRLRLCRLPADTEQHTLDAARRMATRAGSLLSALLRGAYKIEVEMRSDLPPEARAECHATSG